MGKHTAETESQRAYLFQPVFLSYRARNFVETFVNRIKRCRRIATRYDKRATNYLAFNKLASIRRWLRLYESTSQSDPGRLEITSSPTAMAGSADRPNRAVSAA